MVTLTVLCGIPGAGKSTWAQSQDAPVVSFDVLRKNRHMDRVAYMQYARRKVETALRDGSSVIVDACSTKPHHRAVWLTTARSVNAATRLLLFPCDPVLAAERQKERPPPQRVSPAVIRRYAQEFRRAQVDCAAEPWDEVSEVTW